MSVANPPPLSAAAAAHLPEFLTWLRRLADEPGEVQPNLALYCGMISARLAEAAAATAAEVAEMQARPLDPLAAGPTREAMVLGFVHGMGFGRAFPDGAQPCPPDSEIVTEVLRAGERNSDRFPHLAAIARREMIPASDPVVMAWLREYLGVEQPPGTTGP